MPDLSPASPGPAQLRRDLREGDDPLLDNRRAIAALSIFSATVLGGIALFQVGLIKKLPDPPLPPFDAGAVNGSTEAYARFSTPDALLGMANAAATACLAGAGMQDRWRDTPWIPLSLAAKAAVDATVAAKLTLDQWTKFGKFSIWSLLAAAASISAFPLTLPEAKRALRML
ncbi:MAG: hypothetical protein JO340_17360 [Acidobacteriaceae bacterium]|nr:hypothetical protein [Acidobacteriaceae bacterium]